MTPNPLLLDVTPATGLTLDVTGDLGGLAGLTLHGLTGPDAAVEIQTDEGTWVQVAYPYTLQAGVAVRLTRTDTSTALTTLFCTSPDGSGGGSMTLGRDAQGYLTLDGEAWPDRAQFAALVARVDAQTGGNAAPGGGVARLRASPGPDLLQQLTGTTQVPAEATEIPAGLTSPVLVGAPTLLDLGGARWLSIPIRALLGNGGAARITLDFGEAYPLVTSTTGEGVTGQVSTEATTSAQGTPINAALGVHLLLAGPHTVVNRLSQDMLPFVDSPTPAAQFPDPGLEVVLGAAPYLRLQLGSQERELPFTAAGGGSVS